MVGKRNLNDTYRKIRIPCKKTPTGNLTVFLTSFSENSRGQDSYIGMGMFREPENFKRNVMISCSNVHQKLDMNLHRL